MAQFTTVLQQIQQTISRKLFDNLADKYNVNKGVRKMTALAHFSVLLYAQFKGLNSLREIETATSALTKIQQKSGLTHTCRSTLADANQRIPWLFYRDLFYEYLEQVKDLFPRHKFDQIGNLLSIDSTTIKLCRSLFPWAQFRQAKGALKIHTVLDHSGNIPDALVVTNGKVHDIRVGRALKFAKGTMLLFDRGYFDAEWFYKLHKDSVYFITRMKSNISFIYNRHIKHNCSTGIVEEWYGYLDSYAGNKCPVLLHLARYIGQVTGKEYIFLTNHLDLSAQTVADLYKQRWQVELFFKWIKQHLKIKTFIGNDENAVLIQIWVAMIAYLIVKANHLKISKGGTAHQFLIFISTHTLMQIPLSQAWQDFQRTKTKHKTYKNVFSRIPLN